MHLRHHFLSCIALALILYPFFRYYSLLVFIFGFFIDLDHYLYDVIRTRNLSLINSYKMHISKEITAKDQLHIFHTVEFVALFLLMVFISKNVYLLIIGMGLMLHLSLDLIYLIYMTRSKIELKQTRAFSLLLWAKRNLLLFV